MQKYQDYYQKMIDENGEIFKQFMKIHDLYVLDQKSHQEQFNETGRKVVEIIRIYERKLCGNSERGQFGKFSSNLADKFWAEVRKDFPKIDFVGAKFG